MVSREQEEKIIKETILLVNTFLKTRKSDIELGKRCGISSSTVGRRLTNKERILVAFPNNGEEIYNQVVAIRSENLQKGKIIGSQSSMLNHTKDGEIVKTPKLLLGVFFHSPEKQEQFLFHLALSTRAKPALLSELFGISEEDIVNIIFKIGDRSSYGAIKYYLEFDDVDQNVAKNTILSLYRDMLVANKNNDKKEKVRLLESVTDAKAVRFLKKWRQHLTGQKVIERKNKQYITDEEIGILLDYQLKYALTDHIISEQFEINRASYRQRVDKYVLDKPQLKERHEDLSYRNEYINRKEFGFTRGQM